MGQRVPVDEVSEVREIAVWIAPSLEELLIRERVPALLAVARRLLDEADAREVVAQATDAARELMPEFRTPSPGVWLQGLVVGLSVARAARVRHDPR